MASVEESRSMTGWGWCVSPLSAIPCDPRSVSQDRA